jgi:hypothetical protein
MCILALADKDGHPRIMAHVKADYFTQDVYFATDRDHVATDSNSPWDRAFGTIQQLELRYGVATVSIPKVTI